MSTFNRVLLAALIGAFLGGCAASAKAPVTLAQKLAARQLVVGDPVRRISNYRLDGWSYLDDRHIIIESGVRDRYLVSLRQDCEELRSAIDIGVRTYTGSLMDNDSLVVRAPGGYAMDCRIDALHGLVRVQKPEENEQ
jgi:hypothetical protein